MRVASLLFTLATAIAVAPSTSLAQVDRYPDRSGRVESEYAPPIDMWLDQISYDRGAHIRPYFTTEPGAYVVVVRVTSDGELRVMYPSRPSEQRPYELGQFTNDRVPITGDPTSRLYESSGTGFVFAIASYQRFDFKQFARGSFWNSARLAAFDRNGDPFQVIRKFVERVLPRSAEFSLDYEVYEVYSRGNVYASGIYGGGIYGNRYGYNSLNDYHDACLTAFGFRYTHYCRSFNGGYYGPIIVTNTPRTPRNPGVKEKLRKPGPVSPDPVVPTGLLPEPAEGVQPVIRADEAARERYQRMRKQTDSRLPSRHPVEASPRADNRQSAETRKYEPIIYRSMPSRNEPRSEPRSQPRSEPRAMEGHQPTRSMPSTPARVEVRNEPRSAPAPRVEREKMERAKDKQ